MAFMSSHHTSDNPGPSAASLDAGMEKHTDGDSSTMPPSTHSLNSKDTASTETLVLTFDGDEVKTSVVRAPEGRALFSTITEGTTFENEQVLAEKLKDSQGNVHRPSFSESRMKTD